MPYCRRCGTKLDEDAHFCHKCGTPVVTYAPFNPATPPVPLRKDPIIIAAIVLVSILIVGVVVATLLAAPFSNVNIGETIQDKTANVDKLNIKFKSTSAKVNIFTQNVENNNFVILITGSASKGLFGGDTGNPVQVEIYNDTVNGVQTVTVKLEESTAFSRYNVVCNVYVNTALTLNLNVTSQAGQVSLNADKPATFESLNLQASAGAVGANLQNATFAGNINLRTQAGTVDFRTSQINVEGNNTVDLCSNAGSVNIDITQTKSLLGSLQVNAVTEMGSVNAVVTIDGDVGAKITSQADLGSIYTDLQHFSGNQSPIQSDNYPAASNIEIEGHTRWGSININAAYQSSSGPTMRN
jgi:zinc-ribbon domain